MTASPGIAGTESAGPDVDISTAGLPLGQGASTSYLSTVVVVAGTSTTIALPMSVPVQASTIVIATNPVTNLPGSDLPSPGTSISYLLTVVVIGDTSTTVVLPVPVPVAASTGTGAGAGGSVKGTGADMGAGAGAGTGTGTGAGTVPQTSTPPILVSTHSTFSKPETRTRLLTTCTGNDDYRTHRHSYVSNHVRLHVRWRRGQAVGLGGRRRAAEGCVVCC